ncbi:MAG: STAS domain-containing protein [Isosphaeraceae bacterium]|nr:STAS domain-containing protein [Isosphaeraceae bacterium]
MTDPPRSRLRLENIEGVIVVHFVDDKIVSDDTIEAVAGELFELVDQAGETRLLLSFRNVSLLSSSALASLMNFDKRVKQQRGTLKFCGLKPVQLELLRVTGLDRVFQLYPDEQSALDTF